MAQRREKKITAYPTATSTNGVKGFGIKQNPDGTVDNVLVPYSLLLGATPVLEAKVNDDGELILTIEYQKIEE